MKFFDNLPNVYVGEGIADTESFKYRLVKNVFRRVRTRPDLEKYVNSFETYEIRDGETPATLALRFMDDQYSDWVILIANQITDVYTQWPKGQEPLVNYVNEKYEDPDSVHHYETNEIRYNDVVFIKQGIEVNKSYRTILPNGTTKSEVESIYPVSNYEHEYYENEKKRLIRIPNPTMSDMIIDEFERLVAYEPHSELDEFNNKKTPMSVAARFLDITGYVTGSIARTTDIGTVTSYDNGPGSTTVKVGSTDTTTTATTTTTTSNTTTTTVSLPGAAGTSTAATTTTGY